MQAAIKVSFPEIPKMEEYNMTLVRGTSFITVLDKDIRAHVLKFKLRTGPDSGGQVKRSHVSNGRMPILACPPLLYI